MGELIFGLQNPRNYLNPSPNLRPSQNDVPNMQVKINEGKCWVGQTVVTVFTSLTSTITAPAAGLARIDIVGVSGPSGNLQVLTGTPTPVATPPVPPVPTGATFYPICLVLLQASTTIIANTNLIDVRELANFGQASAWDHNTLSGRSSADAHPESAITGLVADLADRPTTATLTAALASKADTDGTPSQFFYLNDGTTGAPTLNGRFGVERGVDLDVEVRWNETTDKWQLTNDGTNFFDIATIGGSSGAIDSINGIAPDVSADFTITAKTGSFVIITAAVAGITIEDGDWLYWNLPTATIAPASNIIVGSMTVPASCTVSQVRLGIRRTDDTADGTLTARATQTGTPGNTISTNLEGPQLLSIPTPLTAGQRLGFAAENTDVVSKTVIAMAAALVRRV